MGALPSGSVRLRILIAMLACAACLPAPAVAIPTVALKAALSPERLGKGTTIHFGFSIAFPEKNPPRSS